MWPDSELEPSYGMNIELTEDNPEVTLALSKIARKLIKVLEKRYVKPVTESISRIRSALNVNKYTSTSGSQGEIVIAVDSTWSKPPIELVAGVFGVIVSGYVVVGPSGTPSYEITDVAMRLGNVEDRVNASIELTSKILEFNTAYKAINKHRYADILMLDGALYFSTRPSFFYPVSEAQLINEKPENVTDLNRLASIASAMLIRLLDKCDKMQMPVVGVVKRVSSTFIATIVGEHYPDLYPRIRHINDKALLSYVLEPGEYVVLDNYLEVFRKHLNMVLKAGGYEAKRIKEILKILELCEAEEGDEALKKLCEYMRNTAIVYYMPKSDLIYKQVARIDVYPKNALDKVLKYVMENTTQNAVPIPIDYVDRFVRLESSVIKRLYKLAILYSNEAKENVSIVLGLTNPQKSYLFE